MRADPTPRTSSEGSNLSWEGIPTFSTGSTAFCRRCAPAQPVASDTRRRLSHEGLGTKCQPPRGTVAARAPRAASRASRTARGALVRDPHSAIAPGSPSTRSHATLAARLHPPRLDRVFFPSLSHPHLPRAAAVQVQRGTGREGGGGGACRDARLPARAPLPTLDAKSASPRFFFAAVPRPLARASAPRDGARTGARPFPLAGRSDFNPLPPASSALPRALPRRASRAAPALTPPSPAPRPTRSPTRGSRPSAADTTSSSASARSTATTSGRTTPSWLS